jgi:hypothetical protein
MLSSNPLKTLQKSAPKKLWTKNFYSNKSKKTPFFVLFLLITFLGRGFKQLLQLIRNQHQIPRYLISILHF